MTTTQHTLISFSVTLKSKFETISFVGASFVFAFGETIELLFILDLAPPVFLTTWSIAIPTARPPIGFPLPPVFLRIILFPLPPFTETFTKDTFFFGWTFFFAAVTFFFVLAAVVGFFVVFGAALMSASRDWSTSMMFWFQRCVSEVSRDKKWRNLQNLFNKKCWNVSL